MLDLFNQPPLPELTGEFLRDKGIAAAINHANKKISEWSISAYNHFLTFIETADEFKTEDVRLYAESLGFDLPPTKRAWGAVVLRVAREKRIKKIGHVAVDNPKAHKCFCTLWKVIK